MNKLFRKRKLHFSKKDYKRPIYRPDHSATTSNLEAQAKLKHLNA